MKKIKNNCYILMRDKVLPIKIYDGIIWNKMVYAKENKGGIK